jgi:hypothetical protein
MAKKLFPRRVPGGAETGIKSGDDLAATRPGSG